MSFNIDDYVDVAERIRIFREKHPDGSLQADITLFHNPEGFLTGVLCKATAWRTPDDEHPGNGHSFLGVPGKTPYTKDSEVENAETSAWGRAIVAALAADTKKVASADEVRAKQEGSANVGGQAAASSPHPSGSAAATSSVPAAVAPTEKQIGYLRKLMREAGVDDVGKPVEQLTKQECSSFIEQFKSGTFNPPELAAQGAGFLPDDDEGIPF